VGEGKAEQASTRIVLHRRPDDPVPEEPQPAPAASEREKPGTRLNVDLLAYK
jgi:hypothetical protein